MMCRKLCKKNILRLNECLNLSKTFWIKYCIFKIYIPDKSQIFILKVPVDTLLSNLLIMLPTQISAKIDENFCYIGNHKTTNS